MKKLLFILALLVAGAAAAYVFYFAPQNNTLTITLNTEATDIGPYGLNLNNATRNRNIYEGLVAFDRNLKIVPALAVSWGNTDELTWEFRLRQGVTFHDGSVFSAQSFIDSFEAAKASGHPQIASAINSVDSVSLLEDGKLQIKTKAPDPLLLSRLTKLFVFKDGHIGTGPYYFEEWLKGERFVAGAYEGYWGAPPNYSKLRYLVKPNRTERKNSFNSGETDILVAVPYDQAQELPESNLKENYGLEVVFLMFKLNDPVFQNRSTRTAIQKLIDPETIREIGNGFVRPASQFVAEGVYGYNQELMPHNYDPEREPRDLFGSRLERVTLDYLASFQTLSEYLSQQLKRAGFSVKPRSFDAEELLELVAENDSRLFVMGWRAEDGDAGSFYDTFIHSRGEYNNGRYVNAEVDRLIEQARTEMDPGQRLNQLQQIGERVNQDLVGVPLFETSRLYAVQDDLEWEPRLDGLVLGAEVR
jgi:peptide/nickel transport system substrate-binding protein